LVGVFVGVLVVVGLGVGLFVGVCVGVIDGVGVFVGHILITSETIVLELIFGVGVGVSRITKTYGSVGLGVGVIGPGTYESPIL
jgi:hypothetical protein